MYIYFFTPAIRVRSAVSCLVMMGADLSRAVIPRGWFRGEPKVSNGETATTDVLFLSARNFDTCGGCDILGSIRATRQNSNYMLLHVYALYLGGCLHRGIRAEE